MTRYFLICASADHVQKGVEGGFAQAGHGRNDLMSKPAKGDRVVFYSAKDLFENGEPLQQFTAIGEVTDDKPYQPNAHSSFKPYRRNVRFKKHQAADIRPLLEKLEFIKNPKRWGFYLMGGFRELSADDFHLIEKAMKK